MFDRLGVKISLMKAYNREANGKVERGHGPIVKAIVRTYDGRVGNFPRLLQYLLWTDHSLVTRYMAPELTFRQKPIMPVEGTITSWMTVNWANEMSPEELLVVLIRQLERRSEDVE